MILKKADNTNLNDIIKIYEEAFPFIERKPFDVMLNNSDNMEILAIEDKKTLGLVISAVYKDIVLVDYLAVDKNERGKNIGSTAINLIRQRYDGKRIYLEIEKPDEKYENNYQREHRKAFYIRNGLRDSGIDVFAYDSEMEIMLFNEPITFEEHMKAYEAANIGFKEACIPKLIRE